MHLLVLWILFENVMSLHRTKAAIIGLLEANRVNEWVVTEKLGNVMKERNNARASTSRTPRSWFRLSWFRWSWFRSQFRFRIIERYAL